MNDIFSTIFLTVLLLSFLVEAVALWRYTSRNRIQKTLMVVIIIWFLIFLGVAIDFFIRLNSDESYVLGVMNFRGVWTGTIGIISLGHLISTVLYAKHKEVMRSCIWCIPILVIITVYIVWSLCTGTPINYKYSSFSELWQNRFSFTVILRFLIAVQILYVAICTIVSVWKVLPLYSKYCEDNYSDPAYNINWMKIAVWSTIIISAFYFALIFTSNSLLLILYQLSVWVSFILITDKALRYKEFIPPHNIIVHWSYWRGWRVEMQPEETAEVPAEEILCAEESFDSYIKKTKAFTSPSFMAKDVYQGVPELDSKILVDLLARRGYTFQSYVRKLRIDEACEIIKTQKSITNKELAFRVGLSSDSVFSRSFVAVTGITPIQYKKRLK